jgi:hypothetical protein
MKKIISSIFLCTSLFLQAQYDYVGAISGLSTLQGTARFVGSGGIMGSVGPDISTLSTNPATIGMFSKTEFSFTPSLQVNNTGAEYIQYNNGARNAKLFDDTKVNFVLNNLGIVFATRRDRGSLKSSNFAIGLNRTANFNRRVSFGATNNNYNYSEYTARLLSEVLASNLDITLENVGYREYAAYGTGVLFAKNGNKMEDFANGNVMQSGFKDIKGGINELSFAWAGSIKDKGYVGVSLGIPILNMELNTFFREEAIGNTNNKVNGFYGNFLSHQFNETAKFSGAGVNLKIGGLVKLNKFARVSGFFHTPTFYNLTENYTITHIANFTNSSNNSATIPASDFEYVMISPLKAGVGLSSIIGKYGFVGVEYEYNSMATTRVDFKTDPLTTNYINNIFKTDLQGTHTLKVGGEFAYETLRLRLGYNHRTALYVSDAVVENASLETKTITAGIGYKGKRFALDFAFMNTQFSEFNSFYTDGAGLNYALKSNNVLNHFMTTFNFRFD